MCNILIINILKDYKQEDENIINISNRKLITPRTLRPLNIFAHKNQHLFLFF